MSVLNKQTPNNQLKIISYNLHYNRANGELADLVDAYSADILCVQECDAELLPARIGNLQLADNTKESRLAMGMYYRLDRFARVCSASYNLEQSVLEKFLVMHDERLLITDLYDYVTDQQISVGSMHAMHLMGSNALRRRQIEEAHGVLKSHADGSPAIIVGDYNYPLFKRGLKACIENTGYELSWSDRPTYYLNKYIKAGYFDIAAALDANIEKVLSLPKGLSDHTPILVQVSL